MKRYTARITYFTDEEIEFESKGEGSAEKKAEKHAKDNAKGRDFLVEYVEEIE